MQLINQFYDIQGKAERINNTPFLFSFIIYFTVALLRPVFVSYETEGISEPN